MTAARRRTDIATAAVASGLRHPTGRPGLAGPLPRGPLRLSAVAAGGLASGSAASFLWIKV